MPEYPRQIIIEKPLWDFMEYCEVYCSASCCGLDAFEIHAALLLRKVIDKNLSKTDGNQSFNSAWNQLIKIISHIDNLDLESTNHEIPIWSYENCKLPEYWLPENDIRSWLNLWNDAFTKASHYGGLRK
ncbi:MAG: DUF6331 family protein [Anaerolineaceae bacterium]